MKKTQMLALNLLVLAAMVCHAQSSDGLKDATVLIVRHAEKPASGQDLTPAGYQRADAYVKYFSEYQVDGKPLKFDSLFAASDSKNSHRPRLTLEPLSKALRMPIDLRFTDKTPEVLAKELKSSSHGKGILVCWRHGEIPALIGALGGDPEALIPGGKWPADQFAWVIELHFDGAGQLRPDRCRRVEERLMPADLAK